MTSDRDPGTELATVHHLPVLAGEIVDAELVDEYDRLSTQRGQAAARREAYVRDVVTVARGVRTVATHHRTRRVGKALFRHLLDIGLGHAVIVQRIARHATYATFREQITAAGAAGDMEALVLWQDRLRAAQDHRSRVLHDLPQTLKHLALGGVVLALVLVCVLAGLGVALTAGVGVTWRQYWGALVIAWRVVLVVVAMLAVLAPVWWLWNAHRLGKASRVPAPVFAEQWVDGDEGREIMPTADSVIDALRYLGISALDKAVKAGWGAVGSPLQLFEEPVQRDGKGYKCAIRLPKGAYVEAIMGRKAALASNLRRTQREVWITEPSAAVLGLWIANPGVLSQPVDPWPLLAELETAQTDYWKSVPVGFDLRGDVAKARFFECNWALGGAMGSGKSTLAIVGVSGAMLDPLVEIDVFVCAPNLDWEPMRPRLRTLETGTGDDVPDAAVECMRELYDSIEYRGRALESATLNPEKSRSLTRKMAERDERLRPRIVVIDECQRAFADTEKVDKTTKRGPTRGEVATDVAVQLVNAGRKYGITLILLTPEPTGNSLPRKLLSVFTHKACGAIGDQTSNDAVLGTGSYKTGISAIGLDPKDDNGLNDCGTLMTRGFMSKAGLLRSCYLSVADAERVTARAMELRSQKGIVPESERRDLLDDVDEVLDARPMAKATDVCAGLRRLASGYAPYAKLTAETLRDQLAVLGAQVKLLDGVLMVRASVVTAALTMRDADED